MTEQEINKTRKTALHQLLMSYAPNLEAMNHVDNMTINHASALDYIMALSDGLKYGNWPWTTYCHAEAKDGK